MNEATQDAYRKLAEHFYNTRLAGQPPSPKRITDALKAVAGEYRPDYWRRLRNALAFDQAEKGYKDSAERINSTANPATQEGGQVKAKQRRIKKVDAADHAKLLDHFKNDPDVLAVLEIARVTGARPAEITSIRNAGMGRIHIIGAKKSHAATRGADRTIQLGLEAMAVIERAMPRLARLQIGPIQDRIRNAGKKLWPTRKALPTLYSYRHQLGSNLKASGLDRAQVAYLMGHQATGSVDRYGNRKMGNGKAPLPEVPDGTDLSAIRENHTEMADFDRGVDDGYVEDGTPMSPAEKIFGPEGLSADGKEAGKPSEKPQYRQTPEGGGGLNM